MAFSFFKIGDLEKKLHINRRTYYRWEAAGKISKAKRDPMSKQRFWTEADIQKFKKVTGR